MITLMFYFYTVLLLIIKILCVSNIIINLNTLQDLEVYEHSPHVYLTFSLIFLHESNRKHNAYHELNRCADMLLSYFSYACLHFTIADYYYLLCYYFLS